MTDNPFEQFRQPAADNPFSEFAPKPVRPTATPEPAKPKLKRTWGEAASDTALGVVQGGVNLIGGTASLVERGALLNPLRDAGANLGLLDRGGTNVAADLTSRANEYLGEKLSPVLKRKKQELAETEGFIGSAKKVITDPVLAGQFVAEQVPNIATLGYGTVATGARAAAAARPAALATRQATLTRGGTVAEANAAGKGIVETARQKAGQRFLTGSGTAMESGNANVQAREEALNAPDEVWDANPAFQRLTAGGMTREAAKDVIATQVGMTAAGVTAPLAAVGARVSAPFETSVFTRAVTPGGLRGLATPAGVGKVAQGMAAEAAEETVQEGGARFGTNVGLRRMDPNQELFEGVPEAAGTGAALGLLLGGGMGAGGVALSRGEQPTLRRGQPPQTPTPDQPAPPAQDAAGGVPEAAQAQPELQQVEQPEAGAQAEQPGTEDLFKAQLPPEGNSGIPDNQGATIPPPPAAMPFPDAPAGSLQAAFNVMDPNAPAEVAAVAAAAEAEKQAGKAKPASKPAAESGPSMGAPPPWVNAETGEFTPPSDDMLAREIRTRIELMSDAGKGILPLNKELAQSWGVELQRLRAIRARVLEQRKSMDDAVARARQESAAATETSQDGAAAPAIATEGTVDEPAAGPRSEIPDVATVGDVRPTVAGEGDVSGEAGGVGGESAAAAEGATAEVGPEEQTPLGLEVERLVAGLSPAERAEFEARTRTPSAVPDFDLPAALAQVPDDQVRAVAQAAGRKFSPKAPVAKIRASLAKAEPDVVAQKLRPAIEQAIAARSAAPADAAPVAPPVPATAAARRARQILGADPGATIRVSGQGRELQAGSRFQITLIDAQGAVSFSPMGGGMPFTMSAKDLSREAKAGAAFDVEAARPQETTSNDRNERPDSTEAAAQAGTGQPDGSQADAGGTAGRSPGDAGEPVAAVREDMAGAGAAAEPQAALSDQEADRRANEAERARIDALPADERDAEIATLRARVAELEQGARTNQLTGLPNKAAFEADEALGWPAVVAIDMDGLKRLNDTVGHENADAVLRALGRELDALASDTARFYHRSGDEFAARFKSKAEAETVMAELQSDLEGLKAMLVVEVAGQPAQEYEYRGIGISYGLGANYEAADLAANEQKRERLAAGIREDARADGPPRRLREAARDPEGREGDADGAAAAAQEVVPAAAGNPPPGTKLLMASGNILTLVSVTEDRVQVANASGSQFTVEADEVEAFLDPADGTEEFPAGARVKVGSQHGNVVRGLPDGRLEVAFGLGLRRAVAAKEVQASPQRADGSNPANDQLFERLAAAAEGRPDPTAIDGEFQNVAPASIEAAAAEAATSPTNDLPPPTDGQKEAGNYKKGKLRLHGLELSIENPAGTRRRPEWPPLAHHYGYIRRTEGADGDHIDVFLGDNAGDASLPVFVVNQVNRDGKFDEHKVVMGFADEAAARQAYLANYSKGWSGLGSIRGMSLDEFKAWLQEGDTTKPVKAPKPASKQAKKAAAPKPDTEANTEDSGAELWYNRRNRTGAGLQWSDLEDLNATLKAKEAVKSKVWPRPDYEALVNDGMHPVLARLLKQVYDGLAAKPKVYGAATDEQLREYVETIGNIRDKVFAALQKVDAKAMGSMLVEGKGPALVEMINQTGLPNLEAAIFPGDPRNRYGSGNPDNNRRALLIGGNKIIKNLRINIYDLRSAAKDVDAGWPTPREAWERMFVIRESKAGSKVYRGGKEEVLAEAAFYVVKKGQRRIVADGLPTREAAIEKARELATQNRKKGETLAEEAIDLENAVRTGAARRGADEDITSDRLRETFGFKGVNFGNWMKGDSPAKRRERQLHLNHTYDAFQDLAELLNMPPKALSLNGMLGLAIGAQGNGRGSGAAHFVPGVNEINLTRAAGVGSLAHEWGHAMDHYFAVQAGDRFAKQEMPFITHAIADGIASGTELRPEVLEAFKALHTAMTKRALTAEEMAKRLEQRQADALRRLNSWINPLRGELERRAKPADKDRVLAEFDALAERIRAGDLGEGYVPARNARGGLRPVLADLRTLVKDATGRVPSKSDFEGLAINAEARAYAVANKSDAAEHVPQMAASNYAIEAMKLDKDKRAFGGGNYWKLPTEMLARAFQSYALDRLAERNARNDYLTRPQMDEAVFRVAQKMGLAEDGDRYPRGEERKAINEAFDTLTQTLRTREDDAGNVALFSQPGEPGSLSNPLPYPRHRDAPVGAWVTDTVPGIGAVLFEVRNVPLDKMVGLELDPAGRVQPDKQRDVDSYEARMRAGEAAPNLRGYELANGTIQVADGNRRLQAARAAGLKSLPVAVRPVPSDEQRALVEAELVETFARPAVTAPDTAPQARVRAWIGKATSTWGDNAPRVEVVADGEGLPARAKTGEGYKTADGYYDDSTGTVYLVANRIPTQRDALRVLAHESVGHYGVESITGPVLWEQIGNTVANMRENPKHATLFAEVDRRYKGANAAIALRETLAVMAEKGVRNSVMDRAIAAVHKFIRDVLGIDLRFSDAELRQHLVAAARYVRDGRRPREAAQPDAQAEPAFSKGTRSAFTDAMTFAGTVRAFLDGKLPKDRAIQVTEGTPDVLVKLGAPDVPIVMAPGTLTKFKFAGGDLHPEITQGMMTTLVKHLHEPVAVFDSATEKGALVVMTEVEADGKRVMASLHVRASSERMVVNRVTSLYGRERREDFARWAREGKLRYLDRTRVPAWLTTAGLQSPGVGPATTGTGRRVLLETDVIKPFSSGSGAYSMLSDPFYSALAESVQAARGAPKKGDAAAWKGWLDGAQRRGEFRQSERDWLGLDAWLEGRESTTRAELAEFVQANQVQVNDMVLGGVRTLDNELSNDLSAYLDENGADPEDYETAKDWQNLESRIAKEAAEARADGDIDEFFRLDRLASEANDRAVQLRGGTLSVPTKFSEYQFPGGENYRELLLTLPAQGADPVNTMSREQMAALYEREVGYDPTEDNPDITDSELRELLREYSIEAERAGAGVTGAIDTKTFLSGHFDQPNVLAHVRFNERTDADGKRVLFIEEIQSDWHQQGRKRGYAMRDFEAQYDQLDAKANERIAAGADFSSDEVRAIYREMSQLQSATEPSVVVPDAPFKGTDEWAMLAFKRMVRWAVDNGFERIAWTTGEQQAARYDLSKQIGILHVAKLADGDYRLRAFGPGGADIPQLSNKRVKESELEDFVGKDLAEKIVRGEGGEVNDRTNERSYSGLDLKVGGEGMRGFYDKILPSAVNKWAKKFGGKVGSTVLAPPTPGRQANGTMIGPKVTPDLTPTVHALDLTDAMRDTVRGGQPLFSQPPDQALADLEAVMAAGRDDSVLKRARERLANLTPKKVKDALRSTWLGALGTNHLTELGSDYFEGMRHYTDFLKQMESDRNTLMTDGEALAEKARKWAVKHKAEARRLFDLMHAATIDGVDPAKQYQVLQFRFGGALHDVTRKNVADAIKQIRQQMRERSGDPKQNMLDRIKALTAMQHAEQRRKGQYGGLVARWNELTPEAQQLYKEFRDAYAERSDAIEEALVQRIEDLKGDGVADSQRRALVAKIREQFETNRLQGVYFPLQRFGKFFVAAEKADTTTFLMYESLNEAERAEKDLKARGWKITSRGKRIDAKADQAPSGTFVAEVIGELRKANISEKTQDSIYQLYLNALPELSMRKHQIHRKAVPGFDPDAVRAFGWHMQHGSHQLAKLRYMHKLEGVLKLLETQQKEARKAPDADVRRIAAGDAVLEELNRRHEWIANPMDSGLTNLASSFGFTYYLGATPAAALVNLSQTAIVTFPVLAARYGPVKAMNALLAGTRDSMRTVGNIDKTLTAPEEIKAYQALKASGAIDKTQAHNLAGIAEGGLQGYNPTYAKTMEVIGWAFHKAEVVNREASAMAAFRLARQDGMEFDAAVKHAHDVVIESHFDYSNANRARFMQSGTAKVLLMFRQYSLNMTWFLARNTWQATKGMDPAVRKEARRKLTGVLGMTAIFSGVLGLPLMSTMFGVINAAAASFGDDDEPFSAETEFRNFLADMLGPDAARLLATGAANELTGADIASRVSLSQLWFRDADRELEGRGMYYHLLEQAAGPLGGVLKNVLVGKQQIDEGHVMRGVETMLPKALKDGMKGMRYATQGVNNFRGDPLVEDVSAWQAMLQLQGFTPAQVARQYDANSAVKGYEQHILNRRQHLNDAYALAWRLGDQEAMAATIEKMQAFNRANPEMAISAETLRRSLKSRLRYSQRAEDGIIVNPKLEARIRGSVRFNGEG